MTAPVVLADENVWLEERRKGVTASEAAIVLGVAPRDYGTAHDLWAQKLGLQQRPDIGTTLRVRWGKSLEDYIVTAYERLTGRKVINHGAYAIWRSASHPWLSCTLDREIVSPRGCLEIKATTFVRDEVPDHQAVQMQLQQFVCGFEYGELATFVRTNDWKCAPELFAALWRIAQEKCAQPSDAAWSVVDEAIAKAAAGRLYLTEIERDDDLIGRALPTLERFVSHLESKTPLPEGFPHD